MDKSKRMNRTESSLPTSLTRVSHIPGAGLRYMLSPVATKAWTGTFRLQIIFSIFC